MATMSKDYKEKVKKARKWISAPATKASIAKAFRLASDTAMSIRKRGMVSKDQLNKRINL